MLQQNGRYKFKVSLNELQRYLKQLGEYPKSRGFNGVQSTTLTATTFRGKSDQEIRDALVQAFERLQDTHFAFIDVQLDKRDLKEALFAANIRLGVSTLMVALQNCKEAITEHEAYLSAVVGLTDPIAYDSLTVDDITRIRNEINTMPAPVAAFSSHNEPRVTVVLVREYADEIKKTLQRFRQDFRSIEREITQKNTQTIEIDISATSAAFLGLT